MKNEAISLIDKIATKLGTTAEYLFEIMVKQAPYAALQSTVVFALVWIIVIVVARFTIKKYKELKRDDDDTVYLEFLILIIGVFLLIGLIIMTFWFFDNLCGFYNPEFWALQRIINQL